MEWLVILCDLFIVPRAGLLWSQQGFEWWWSYHPEMPGKIPVLIWLHSRWTLQSSANLCSTVEFSCLRPVVGSDLSRVGGVRLHNIRIWQQGCPDWSGWGEGCRDVLVELWHWTWGHCEIDSKKIKLKFNLKESWHGVYWWYIHGSQWSEKRGGTLFQEIL